MPVFRQYALSVKRLMLGVGLLVSLVAAACSSSAQAPTDSVTPATVSDGQSDDEAAAFSLGEREASFGAGSLVIAASKVAERLENLSGPWFFFPHYTYEPVPTECGYATPLALEGAIQSRESPTDAPFGDQVGVFVQVYADEATAAEQVAILNGPQSSACDAAGVARLEEELAGPRDIPGAKFDVGDGRGLMTDVPFDHENAAARRFVGKVSIGDEERELENIEWIAATGPMVVHASAMSLTGRAEELVVEMAEVLLSEEFPVAVIDASIDEAVDASRRAVVPNDALPSYYEETSPLTFATSSPETACYNVLPDFYATGPSWQAITPGVGGSQVQQATMIFSSQDQAAKARADLVEQGTDCFEELVGLSEPMFTLVGEAINTETVATREVTTLELNYVQNINGEEFDADVQMSLVQDGRYVFVWEFFGLAGDSPNLAELAALSADRVTP